MIEFMFIAAPRSGTAWAANWFSTERSHCLHEPLFKHHYSELDQIPSRKVLGISCTGVALFHQYLMNHPARKVVLHRDRNEVNASLIAIGLPPLPRYWDGALDRVQGLHVNWCDLFERPEPICAYLGVDFDAERHEMLRSLNVQIDFEQVKPDREAVQRLLRELSDVKEQLT